MPRIEFEDGYDDEPNSIRGKSQIVCFSCSSVSPFGTSMPACVHAVPRHEKHHALFGGTAHIVLRVYTHRKKKTNLFVFN